MKKIILFSFLIYSNLNFAQINLVKNGGFETELTSWQGDAATISPYDKKTGKNSCVINQYVGQEWKAVDQTVSIPKNTFAITFSVWIKTDGIEGGKEAYNTGAMIADFINAGNKSVGSENVAQIKGTTPWTIYTKIVKIPQGAKNIRIMLALAQTSGSIFFDEVKAIALNEADYLKTISPETPVIKTDSKTKGILENGNF